MGDSLCDGLVRMRPPPPETPSFYRSRACVDASTLQMQYAWRAARWYQRLRSAGESTLLATSCFGCTHMEPASCCNRRGFCVQGVCACHTGWSGLDCAHPHDARVPRLLGGGGGDDGGGGGGGLSSSTGSRGGLIGGEGDAVGVRIYVYPMGIEMGQLARGARGTSARRRHPFGTDELFLTRLLEDTTGRGAARTTDPESADLYFVPAMLSHGVAGSGGCTRTALRLAAHYVRTAFPYWARSGGRDHVFFLPGDEGSCNLDGELGARPILMSHWGLLGSASAMGRSAGREREFDDAEGIASRLRNGQYCYSPHKDVVVPAWTAVRPASSVTGGSRGRGRDHDGGSRGSRRARLDPLPPRSASAQDDATVLDLAVRADHDPSRRSAFLLLHADGKLGKPSAAAARRRPSTRANRSATLRSPPRAADAFSQGVLPELVRHYGSTSEPSARVRLLARSVSSDEWRRAKFCLAPSGAGWSTGGGMRLVTLLLVHGCVPLIAQPYARRPPHPEA